MEAIRLITEHRALTLQFLDWLEERPRTRAEVVEAWPSNCPRLAVWEDALADGLVAVDAALVALTEAGRTNLLESASL